MHRLSVAQLRLLHEDGGGQLLGVCNVRVPLHDRPHEVRGEDVAQVDVDLLSVVLVPRGVRRHRAVGDAPRGLRQLGEALEGELLVARLRGVVGQGVGLPVAIGVQAVALPLPARQPVLVGVRLPRSGGRAVVQPRVRDAVQPRGHQRAAQVRRLGVRGAGRGGVVSGAAGARARRGVRQVHGQVGQRRLVMVLWFFVTVTLHSS